MIYRKCIVYVQIRFIQRMKYRETNATSHAFQQVSDLTIFPECFRGPLKMLCRATCGTRTCGWTTLSHNIKCTESGGYHGIC